MSAFNYKFKILFTTFLIFALGNSNAITEKSNINEKDAKIALDKKIKDLYNAVNGRNYNLSFVVFKYAMTGYFSMLEKGKIKNHKYVSIIDFTKSSDKKRFYTVDLEMNTVIYYTYVAHGSNSGLKEPTDFSDKHRSHQSSLGFYITGKTYVGEKGFSMRLHGDENGYNKNMYDRAIVIHTANYVSEDFLQRNGQMGRSWGCPVLPKKIYKKVINTIKDGSVIFAYYNDENYLKSSKYLKISNILPLVDKYVH